MLTARSLLLSLRLGLAAALLASALACSRPGVAPEGPAPEETGGGEGGDAGAGAHADAGTNADAGTSADAGPDAGPTATAPANAIPGELLATADNPLTVPGGKSAYLRFESAPDEHLALRLEFASAARGAKLAVLRWDGVKPASLGLTDSGAGLRFLAVHDPDVPRTHWARIDASVDTLTNVRLRITRTPFADGLLCHADCDRLLQLPLPIDPAEDGYSLSGAIFRYQFGRRDLLMLLRAAGRRQSFQGRHAFQVADLSQWDGLTPGIDVGSPRHASHQRGKDVDLALYGTDGQALFRSYCTARAVDGGRECTPGTRSGLFDALDSARLLGAFYAGGRVTMDFLDRELIAVVAPAAKAAVSDGSIESAVLPLYTDGKHLQHWPNHDNHVHVRVSEAAYSLRADGSFAPVPDEPFEAP